jgi:small conductance mechanosensitive channel
MEKIAVGFVCGLVKILLYLILVLILLSIIGVEITGILTALSALLLAVGLALQNIISNAANGIIIVSSKMFKKGDYIVVDGKEGSISEINFLYTTLITPDNKKITIPNSTIVNNPVIDYDSNSTRRVDIKFSVAYESDVEQVKKIMQDCMRSNGKILLNPEPFCRLNALNDSSIEFVIKCWCDKEDYWSVYFDLTENVFNELKRNKISIPYPQIEMRERKEEVKLPVVEQPLPERVEKTRQEKHEFDLEKVDFVEMFQKNSKKKKKSKSQQNNNELKERAEKINLKEDVTQTKTASDDKTENLDNKKND